MPDMRINEVWTILMALLEGACEFVFLCLWTFNLLFFTIGPTISNDGIRTSREDERLFPRRK